mmetsp:Transcript_115286/g.246371  ORF Transcript_115286/g.246371 Transcript_115286/m.246371 type:complete len:218 (-) Transcript_115286:64-717(-)
MLHGRALRARLAALAPLLLLLRPPVAGALDLRPAPAAAVEGGLPDADLAVASFVLAEEERWLHHPQRRHLPGSKELPLEFDTDVADYMITLELDDSDADNTIKYEALIEQARAEGKPLMVLKMERGRSCRECGALRLSINSGSQVRAMLPEFVVAQVETDHWKELGEDYFPQALFYSSDGEQVDVRGPREGFKRYFDNDYVLAAAMQKVAHSKRDEL